VLWAQGGTRSVKTLRSIALYAMAGFYLGMLGLGIWLAMYGGHQQ
jgi:hypothetical protein